MHRSSFAAASNLTNKYEATRQQVRQFINGQNSGHIIWTKGTTDGVNLAAMTWGNTNIKPGDVIVVLGSEHHANFVPWQQLAQRNSARFEVVKVLPNGDVDMDDFDRLMKLAPKLVAMQHVSNALGNIHDIQTLTQKAKAAGAVTFVDGAQAIATIAVNVESLECDFYAFSGHKLYGPMGIGVLYLSDTICQQLQPVYFGGEMITDVAIEASHFRPLPLCLETGTPNVSGVIGLGQALSFIKSEQYQDNKVVIQGLYQSLVRQLQAIPEITIFGNTESNVGIVSFIVEEEMVGDVATLLNEQGIALRAGHHCAMPLLKALGLEGTLRVSLGCYNTEADVKSFIKALMKSIELLKI